MRRRVLLNIDLGELPDEPEPLYQYADVANIACGGHAGDDASMRRAVQRCGAYATRVGAHPSYPDRAGFGRRALAMAADALRESVADQCARLAAAAREGGQAVTFVKAHGALYHACVDAAVAGAVVGGALDALGVAVTVIGPAGGALDAAAARAGMTFARESFADRATRPDGTLLARGEPGAVLSDPGACAERARAIVVEGVADTVCVHGDTRRAVAVARAVRAALDAVAVGA